jgi:hypothetical protein
MDESIILVEGMAAELEAKEQPLTLVLQPFSVLLLTGLLQLALRHPNVPESSRDFGEQFLSGVREYFADCPHTLDVVRRGDDPNEDRQ